MEFWSAEVIDSSWDALVKLNRRIKFILIGGWAVYLYTHLEKSKDIDIIVDYTALKELGSVYDLHKNTKLSKYEIKTDRFDIDVYVPYYSKLSLPIEEIVRSTRSVEGFMLPEPELLLLLKVGAFVSRRDSIKGRKDAVDIIGLLLYSGLDPKRLRAACDKYGVPKTLIRSIINDADDETLAYLNTNKHYFSKAKKWLLSAL